MKMKNMSLQELFEFDGVNEPWIDRLTHHPSRTEALEVLGRYFTPTREQQLIAKRYSIVRVADEEGDLQVALAHAVIKGKLDRNFDAATFIRWAYADGRELTGEALEWLEEKGAIKIGLPKPEKTRAATETPAERISRSEAVEKYVCEYSRLNTDHLSNSAAGKRLDRLDLAVQGQGKNKTFSYIRFINAIEKMRVEFSETDDNEPKNASLSDLKKKSGREMHA
ncbi:MAG: hypothetical protein NTZ09_21230 [Candidatus Hydrogenedentes bacterium]|nr:hypothetical protein [Candidatus Hydrogenedentota bacterium]